jgi:hypothetical protein
MINMLNFICPFHVSALPGLLGGFRWQWITPLRCTPKGPRCGWRCISTATRTGGSSTTEQRRDHYCGHSQQWLQGCPESLQVATLCFSCIVLSVCFMLSDWVRGIVKLSVTDYYYYYYYYCYYYLSQTSHFLEEAGDDTCVIFWA